MGDGEHEGSRRMKTELLIQMDGLLRDAKDRVFLLAASNLPWDLDSAMLRRLEKRILVDLPCLDAGKAMLQQSLPEGFAQELDYGGLAQRTEEWSGSDIKLLCKEAAMHPLRRLMTEIEGVDTQGQQARSRERDNNDLQMGPVLAEDVNKALQSVHPAPTTHKERYQAWQSQYGAC